VLATGTDAARIIGVDASASAIRYARDLYGSIHGDLEFLAQDPARLAQLSDESVDLVISFDTLENQPDPDRLLREFARVLKPGGLFIGSVPNARMNAHGPGMVADLSRAWDHERLRELVSRHFDWRELYRQSGGVDPKLAPPRLLRSVEGCTPGADDRRDTDCWIAVAAKPDTGSTGSASPRGTRLDAA
jgi:SAM-dependent methyltransferase